MQVSAGETRTTIALTIWFKSPVFLSWPLATYSIADVLLVIVSNDPVNVDRGFAVNFRLSVALPALLLG